MASSPVATQSGTAQILRGQDLKPTWGAWGGQQRPGRLSAPASVHISNERVFLLKTEDVCSGKVIIHVLFGHVLKLCLNVRHECVCWFSCVCAGTRICIKEGRASWWDWGLLARFGVSSDLRQTFPGEAIPSFPEACRLLHPGLSVSPVLSALEGAPQLRAPGHWGTRM